MPPAESPASPRGSARGSWVVLLLPVLVLVVSVAALHTELRGDSLGRGWATTYAVLGPLLALGYVFVTGPRLLPGWAVVGSLVLLLASGVLLDRDQRSALALIPLSLVVLVLLPRAPRARPPAPPTPLSRAGQDDPLVQGDPLAQDDPLGPQDTPLPRAGAPVRIPLLRTRGMLALLGAMSLALLMGYGLLHVALYQEPEESLGIRLTVGALGVVVGLLALTGMVTAVRARGDTLTIDSSGIRRQGGILTWHLPWEEVRAVGIRDLTRVVPNIKAPTPRRVRERRDVRLMLAFTDPGAARRVRFGEARKAPEPFTHEQRLPDLSAFRDGAGLVAVLDQELTARVPRRYAGMMVQRPGQQRPRRG